MSDRPGKLTAAEFVDAAAYAAEAFRRWSLEPDWLDADPDDASVDDPDLPIEERLRRRRQLGSLRILWQELCGKYDVETTGRLLSDLARSCLAEALTEALERVEERHGRLDSGPRMAALALGKLGGNELNFNSDLDLVFVHDAEGESDGRRRLPAREWLSRVARELSGLMETVTARGRVWVIDTRLRPYGQSGSLVWSLDAMEQYFLNEGRAWERYAWLKADVAAGDEAVGRQLLDRLQPFVFRRYLDYGLFDSLRDLHEEIDRKGQREDLADDIKRGPGGIRELEFLVQSLQLLRGGRDRELRCTGFLPALDAVDTLHLLDRESIDELGAAYRFLRTLENRLQAVTGRQTHALPENEPNRAALARLMGASDWSDLSERIEQVRASVREAFQTRFEPRQCSSANSVALWPPGDDLERRLETLGFEDPEAAGKAIERLEQRLTRRPLSAEARRRLNRLMPELFEQVAAHEGPDAGFDDLLDLVETIAQRSAYLSLLHERPQTLERTVRVFRRSDRVARWIIDAPQLLDDLLDPINGFDLPEPPHVQRDDPETTLNALARYRQAGFVRTAIGQLDGAMDRSQARHQLTALAESVLAAGSALTLDPDQPVAVIGYGNLGAAELHYSSDLDLVFLHPDGAPPLRGIQRLINALQLPLAGGKLYEVDTRLRPNGNAGMLVTSIDHFDRYQREEAWTWEHQALIRARTVGGPESLDKRFDEIRREVLCRSREASKTCADLADMRARQTRQRPETPIKRVLGHVQFIAELGVLVCAADEPGLIEVRSAIDQLRALSECGWLDESFANELCELHAAACDERDRAFLERGHDQPADKEMIEAAQAAWERVFGSADAQPDDRGTLN